MSKINGIYFISAIEVITFLIDCLNVIYYASIVPKAIYVCNLLHHNNEHPTYVITYTKHDMTFSALLESA